ncbi:MAG: hypothetical protein GKS06_03560 [Acidobacteria bacterium]|nr:hypothetical protein [Acidobacteriota bacterium]
MKKDNWTRRSLMTGMGAAVPAMALAPSAARAQDGFVPTRHALDAWLGEMTGQHRVFIDSATTHGGMEAVLYANNLFRTQEPAYGLMPSDLAIVICFRHFSTVFAYNHDMWAKYGEQFTELSGFDALDEAPSVNPVDTDEFADQLPSYGLTVSAHIENGVEFAVCDAATSFFSRGIAGATGGEASEIYEELKANAIPNSHFMSAGVVAMTRAQEYGYSLLYAG